MAVAGSKILELEDAVGLVEDGASLGIAGVLLKRKPIAFVRKLVEAGRRDLRVCSFLASLDVDLLCAAGAVAEVTTGYVGFEHLGFAPAYLEAVESGRVRAVETSELLFMAGVRAAVAGLPFGATRGGTGSALVEEQGLKTVTCPYTGEELVAVPAVRPDVTVVHAEAADEHGNVLGPRSRDFLFDSDILLARASKRVIVTVERIVPTDELRGQRAMLFELEVDAVVEAPRGAWPTGLPGVYGVDTTAVRAYLEQGASALEPAGAR
jgi:glutaconate CoA-transferase subunit A